MICSKCKQNKDESLFFKKTNSKTGYQPYCKICSNEKVKIHYKNNTDKILKKKKKYRHTDEYREKARKYEKGIYKERRNELRNNINFRLHMSLRDILRRCLKHKGKNKDANLFKIIGYNTQKLKERLECQFKDGMSWENYGKWHIDHKKPISKFDKNVDISIINSLSNLQPLWAKENLSKGNRF